MGLVTVAWWALFVACVGGLIWTRTVKRRAAAAGIDRDADGDDVPTEDGPLAPRLPKALRDGTGPVPAGAGPPAGPPLGPGTTGSSPAGAAPAAVPSRRLSFSSFDREVLAPVLTAELGPDGLRCPGCVDGSVRRYVHRSDRTPEQIDADVWCAACRRHMTLSGPGGEVDFDDPLAHLGDDQRATITRDLEDYLHGLDVLWAQGKLPQELRRRSVRTP